MEITMISAVMVMVAYFLLLCGAVGFVQDKRFFGSAPKENLAAIPEMSQGRHSNVGTVFFCGRLQRDGGTGCGTGIAHG